MLRLMREHDLLAPGRVGSPRGPRGHDGTIIPANVRLLVAHRSAGDVHRREPGGSDPRGGSLLRRVRRHPCPRAGRPLRGDWNRSAGVRRCFDDFAAASPVDSRCCSITHRNTCRTTSDGARLPRSKLPGCPRAGRHRDAPGNHTTRGTSLGRIEDSFETAKNELGPRPQRDPLLARLAIATGRACISAFAAPWWPPFGIAQTPRRPQKECAGRRTHLAADPLVGTGNPAHCRQARATTHPACQRYRMVTLATGSSSLSSESAFDQKNATVMLSIRTTG